MNTIFNQSLNNICARCVAKIKLLSFQALQECAGGLALVITTKRRQCYVLSSTAKIKHDVNSIIIIFSSNSAKMKEKSKTFYKSENEVKTVDLQAPIIMTPHQNITCPTDCPYRPIHNNLYCFLLEIYIFFHIRM